jgi:hypothetical protein
MYVVQVLWYVGNLGRIIYSFLCAGTTRMPMFYLYCLYSTPVASGIGPISKIGSCCALEGGGMTQIKQSRAVNYGGLTADKIAPSVGIAKYICWSEAGIMFNIFIRCGCGIITRGAGNEPHPQSLEIRAL